MFVAEHSERYCKPATGGGLVEPADDSALTRHGRLKRAKADPMFATVQIDAWRQSIINLVDAGTYSETRRD